MHHFEVWSAISANLVGHVVAKEYTQYILIIIHSEYLLNFNHNYIRL